MKRSDPFMQLISGATVFAPKCLGKRDVLVAGGKIEMEGPFIPLPHGAEVIDARSLVMLPGFLDQHVHIIGGGGEGGFATRAPEISASQLVKAGISTVVGVLGTDGLTRNVENLVAKAKSLRATGLTAFATTGSYAMPSPTITGSVMKDIVFISEVIGVKIAVSDSRSSSPTGADLAWLGSEARLAGLLSGKAGILIMHMGDGKAGMAPLFDLIADTDIPVRVFRPTHVNRNLALCKEALEFAKMGGMIDLNPDGELRTSEVLRMAEAQGVPLENITVSSDGQGSWTRYDEFGAVVEMGINSVGLLFRDFVGLLDDGFPVEDALPFFTSIVAKGLYLANKGVITEGADADFLLVDEHWNIRHMFSQGKQLLKDGQVILPTFGR
jgi:beta-aspartyl-dipeptidase (metallo-type)